MLTQVTHTSSDSSHRQYAIASGIAPLLPISFPTHVSGEVAKIVVDTTQGKSFWSLSKIGFKGFERIAPPITNGYASASVVSIFYELEISAASNHCPPRLPSAANRTVWITMPLTTPARLSVSYAKRRIVDNSLFPAITLAQTSSETISASSNAWLCISKYNELAKSQANERDFSRHNGVNPLFCLAAGCPASTGPRSTNLTVFQSN